MNIGSVSAGTMRKEDLIPCFLEELNNQEVLSKEHQELVSGIGKRMVDEEYYSSEESDYDLEDLFEALDAYCLPYFYFGGHPGDGADYGYWLMEDMVRFFEGLKVGDLSEVPEGYEGEVLLINDHGNMSLYEYGDGEARVIWEVV